MFRKCPVRKEKWQIKRKERKNNKLWETNFSSRIRIWKPDTFSSPCTLTGQFLFRRNPIVFPLSSWQEMCFWAIPASPPSGQSNRTELKKDGSRERENPFKDTLGFFLSLLSKLHQIPIVNSTLQERRGDGENSDNCRMCVCHMPRVFFPLNTQLQFWVNFNRCRH